MTRNVDEDGIVIGEKDLPKKFVLKILGHCETRGLWGVKHTREPVDKMVKFAKNHKLSLPIVQLIVTREGLFLLPLNFKREICEEDNARTVKIDVRIPKSENECQGTEKGEEGSKSGQHCFRIKAHFKVVKGRNKIKKKVEKLMERSTRDENDNICKGCGREQSGPGNRPRGQTDVHLLEKYKKIDWRKHGIVFYSIDNISYGVQDLVFTRVFSMIEVVDVGGQFERERTPFLCHSFVCESHNTAKMLTYALDAAFQAYGKTLRETRKMQQMKNL